MQPNHYDDGMQAGEAAWRSRGGHRGGEWLADQRGLTGDARAEFIEGFEHALLEAEREEIRSEQQAEDSTR